MIEVIVDAELELVINICKNSSRKKKLRQTVNELSPISDTIIRTTSDHIKKVAKAKISIYAFHMNSVKIKISKIQFCFILHLRNLNNQRLVAM